MPCSISFISTTFSTTSCISWIFAQLPQILENYRNKSAEGISPSFLILWFMGDFLSFTSCLVNIDIVLDFQLYLSVFFLCNDVTLCFQYYYYNSVYPRLQQQQQQQQRQQLYVPLSTDTSDSSRLTMTNNEDRDISIYQAQDIQQIKHANSNQSTSEDFVNSTPSSYDSINDNDNGSIIKKSIVGAILNTGHAVALPISTETFCKRDTEDKSTSSVGLYLAWGCTLVYCLSRCPQLYKNYKRKSVDGISPLLFASALMGNLTYTLSILTSCEFAFGSNRQDFILKELPYILGSAGTILFDIGYFYQKYLYRNSGRNTSAMTLESWSDIETRRTNDN